MRRYLGIAASIGFVAMGVFASFDSARAACEGSSVQFSEDFSHPDPSWGPFSKEVFRDRKYIMTAEPNRTVADWPSAALFSGSYTICVNVKLPLDPNSAAGSGLLFWIVPEKNKREGHNYYMAMMSPDGFYWISRQIDGVLSTVLEPATGGEENFLDPDSGGARFAISEKFKATRDGELFLFVNDATVGIPGWYDVFYKNNRGSTRVLLFACGNPTGQLAGVPCLAIALDHTTLDGADNCPITPTYADLPSGPCRATMASRP